MAERQLGIIRRTSLKDVAPGWDECYLTYRPASLGELAQLKETNPEQMSDTQGITFMTDFIKDHTVGGKVMIVQDPVAGSLTQGALQHEDIDYLPVDILMQLFSEMSGSKLDPKDIKAAAVGELKSANEGKPTETSSSTEARQVEA